MTSLATGVSKPAALLPLVSWLVDWGSLFLVTESILLFLFTPNGMEKDKSRRAPVCGRRLAEASVGPQRRERS